MALLMMQTQTAAVVGRAAAHHALQILEALVIRLRLALPKVIVAVLVLVVVMKLGLAVEGQTPLEAM